MTRFAESADGVRIAYTAAGEIEPALVLIHGGMADRTFWENQIDHFSRRRKVIALDLTGHGESGCNRAAWTMQAYGSDVRAVLDAEKVSSALLVGNSLGGPVAVEAAIQVPKRAIGIVGVDTFHVLEMRTDPAEVQARAQAFRTDFDSTLTKMVQMLFHADADPDLMADARRRMAKTSPESTQGMFQSIADYGLGDSIRRLQVPVRCIMGDLYPVKLDENRKFYPDFEAIVLSHTGHYPMLERPDEFNRLLWQILVECEQKRQAGTRRVF